MSTLRVDESLRRLDQAVAVMRGSRAERLARMPIRTALPVLLRQTVRSREAVADTFWGGRMNVLIPEAVSVAIWRFGFFEAEVCQFLAGSLKPGMTFLDVGGHFGFFSLLASALVGPEGRTLTFEPMPKTFAFLSRNLEEHAAHRTFGLVNAAASDAPGELSFQDMGLVLAAYNSAFGARVADAEPTMVPVKAVTVDSIVAERGLTRVDVVKIDAESSEMMVLRGMEETIERFGPRIVLEVGDFDIKGVSSSRELVDWLVQRGYAPFEVRNGAIQPHALSTRYEAGNLMFVKRSTGA